jgi:hypothetical protein
MNNIFDIYDWTAGLHRFVIDTNGNIGIGTVEPKTKLEVNGTIKADNLIINNKNLSEILNIIKIPNQKKDQVVLGGDNPLSNATLSLWNKSGYQLLIAYKTLPEEPASFEKHDYGQLQIHSNINAGPSRAIRFMVNGSGYGEVLRLTPDKKVGINNSNPVVELDVNGNLLAKKIFIGEYNNNDSRKIFSLVNSMPGTTQKAVFENSSNVPNSNQKISVRVNGGNAGDPFIEWRVAGAQGYIAGIDNSDNDKFIISDNIPGHGKNYLTITSNANIGINTSEPNSILSVNGSLSLKTKIVNSNYTLSENDNILLVDNNEYTEIKLPKAIDCEGRVYTIKKINSNKITAKIIPYNKEKIDNQNVYFLILDYESVKIISANNQWYVIP